MNPFKNLFRRRRRLDMEGLEMLVCHFVVLSELLGTVPNCDNLCRMAEKELYKIKVQYLRLKRPTLEEAQTRVKEHAAKNPHIYSAKL